MNEEQYRELQSIWHAALDAHAEGRSALAIRLLQHGIQCALSRSYDDPDRLFRMRRDLAGIYEDLGDGSAAIELYRECGRFYKVGHILLRSGRIAEAVKAYEAAIGTENFPVWPMLIEALFLAGEYEQQLRVLETQGRSVSSAAKPAKLSKKDVTICLLALWKLQGQTIEIQETKELRESWPGLYKEARVHFGNWKSAWTWTLRQSTAPRFEKIRASLCRPLTRIECPQSSRDDADFERMTAQSASASETWAKLMQAIAVASEGDMDRAIAVIREVCVEDPRLAKSYGHDYLRDLLVLRGDFEAALAYHEGQRLDHSGHGRNIHVNLLFLTQRSLPPDQLLDHYGWLIDHKTSFLDDHPSELAALLAQRLEDFQATHGQGLLEFCAASADGVRKQRLDLLVGSPDGYELEERSRKRIPALNEARDFLNSPYVHSVIREVFEDLENALRDSMGIPRIGEGWVAEAEMVRLLEAAFAPNAVLRQASPAWLGGMRFDAFIPDSKLAIEYQGLQHYEPVEVFGGQAGFDETCRRDQAKAELSRMNGVRLEYIRYDEDIRARVLEIFASTKSNDCRSQTLNNPPHA